MHGKERAQTNAGGAQRIRFVNLEHCVERLVFVRNALHLLARDGVNAAAKAHQLHKFRIGASGDRFECLVESTVKRPLVHNIQFGGPVWKILSNEAHSVLGEYVSSH